MLSRCRFLVLGLGLAAVLPGGAALADRADQQEVRLAVERGEIRPLADILGSLRDKLPGEVVGVEVERSKGRWIYELRVVDRGGRLLEVYVDARSGSIEQTREK
jgi:uncharacterized membrane protein YkoI